MQSWSAPTGQCVFCAFRAATKPCRKQYTTRNFSKGEIPFRQRVEERKRLQKSGRFTGLPIAHARKSEGLNGDAAFRKESGQATGSTGNGFGRANQSHHLRIRPLQHSNLRSLTQEHLKLLKAALQDTQRAPHTSLKKRRSGIDLKSGKHKIVDCAPIFQLDPSLVHWDDFEKKIISLYSEKKKDGPNEEMQSDTDIKTKIEQSFVREGNEGLKSSMMFAYIDHVIARQFKPDAPVFKRIGDLRYPTEWYAGARAMQRVIHLHVGPTNSGKTYNALKRLEESGNGYYAGPLRLLAHEVYSRFQAKGVACNLVTGDDVRVDESGCATLSASTVEMVDTNKHFDVAVIDEIQMIAHEERGWAWTRALLGSSAKEVHLCGETRVVPLIRELAASMGDTLHVHHYDRLNPLKAMSRSLRGNLNNLRKGDCVVSFSVIGIHAMKRQIEIDTGRRVAIVYGGLPPETRAQQAALFNDPSNDYDFLVASDAIGMGLNLSIKRIIFESTWKHDGIRKVPLSVSQIKQIAGRAGRFRTANEDISKEGTPAVANPDAVDVSRAMQYRATTNIGLVTCLDEADLPNIHEALGVEAEPIKAAGILPPADFIDEFASELPKNLPFEYILRKLHEVAVLHPRYFLCNIKDQVHTVKHIESIKELSIDDRCLFGSAPVDSKTLAGQRVLHGLATCVAEKRVATIADIKEIPLEVLEQPVRAGQDYLHALEGLHKALILFLWLSYRVPSILKDQEMAMHTKSLVEEKISQTLLEFSANPKLRKRLLEMRRKVMHTPPSAATPVISEQPVTDGNEVEPLLGQPALPIDWSQGTVTEEHPTRNESEATLVGAHG